MVWHMKGTTCTATLVLRSKRSNDSSIGIAVLWNVLVQNTNIPGETWRGASIGVSLAKRGKCSKRRLPG